MTRAVNLANLADSTILSVDAATDRVGIGSTQPTEKLQVVGVVSATSFFGDGQNLSNTGATLSAASGAQRVVVTSLTSGTMTAAGTDADLAWNSTTNTLSATNISVGTIDAGGHTVGTSATFTGNVSIGGTLTYEDVTNVDSVGVITARSGLKVTSGGASFVGSLTERAVVSATALSADDFCNIDDGLFHYRTGNLGGTTNNLRLKSNVGFNTIMATGDVMNFTLAHNVNATTAYVNNVFIEGVAQTENWVGGSAPSDGGGSGVDIYSFTIIKTASNTYTVIGNQTKTS